MRNASLFLSIFTTIYAAMHLLVFLHARSVLHLAIVPQILLALFFLAMTLAPVASGVLGDRTGPLAWTAFVWMGLAFYLFLGTLPLALTRFFTPPGVQQALFLTLVTFCVLLSVYSVFHARHIAVRQITLRTDKLPPGTDRVRIAVLSDLHLYSVEAASRLDRALKVLQSLEYDILVSLGDLIEVGAHKASWRQESSRLARLTPRLGKFAINGNHDVYANWAAEADISEEFHRDAGFRLLRDEVADVGGLLWIAGVDYPGGPSQPGKNGAPTEPNLLRSLPSGRPVILLKHFPLLNPEDTGLFDVQLSGHSHSGQIWPFSLLVRLQFSFVQGLFPLDKGGMLYVTPGTGTWGPPMRVGTTAEITLVTLEQSRPVTSDGHQTGIFAV